MLITLDMMPPSVNAMYRSIVRGRRATSIISEKGREWYAAAVPVLSGFDAMPGGCPLSVEVTLYGPTRRRYDVDNRAKAVLDALTKAGVIEDDHLIDRLTLIRGPVVKGGRCEIKLEVIDE